MKSLKMPFLHFLSFGPVVLLTMSSLQAQTTVPTGPISGTWQKSGSPYKISGNVYVPVGQKLTITEGVLVEFQDTWKMDVYGKIAILGKANDTVVFTAKNKTNGWRGIKVFGQNATDTLRVWYGKFEYFKTQEQFYLKSRAALKVDSLKGLVEIVHSRFTQNHGIVNGSFNSTFSNVNMRNTGFDNNLSSDLRTSNPSIGWGSASVLRACNISLDSVGFFRNVSVAPNLIKDSVFGQGSRGSLVVMDCKGIISNCNFKENRATAQGAAIFFASNNLQRFNLKLSKCIFFGNVTKNTGSAIYFSLESAAAADRVQLDSCHFEDNKNLNWRFKNFITSEAADIGMLHGQAKIIVNDCVFKKCDAGVSVGTAASQLEMNRCTFTQNPGIAIEHGQNGSLVLNNCLIANNGNGIWTLDGGTPILTNCIVANNYPEPSLAARYLGTGFGIYIGPKSSIELRNSIVYGHRDANGRYFNFYTEAANPSAQNSLIEGSYDSIKYSTKVTPSKPPVWQNVLDTNPMWVNPTAGSGIALDPLTADWNLKNTCDSISPCFDAGANFTGIHKLPLTDINGNPRYLGVVPDIGIIEIQNPNKYTTITKEPNDTTLCANTGAVNISSLQTLGNNLVYQWQKSLNNVGPFSNVNGANSPLLTTTISGAGSTWYRVIVTNSQCNRSDTSFPAHVFVTKLPEPFLGADATIANSGNRLLNAGAYRTYLWNIPKSSPATTATLTVDKTNLDTGKNAVWVEVTDVNGCKGRDTVIITLEALNALKSPASVGIKVYPNPTENILHIDMPARAEQATYELTTMDGRTILQGNLQQSTAINLSIISSGTFILQLQIGTEKYGMRVVK